MKIGRDAFLYMEPNGTDDADFAQCIDCALWSAVNKRCAILDMVVGAYWSCGAFLPAIDGFTGANVEALVTPEEVGLVKREVRCENCKFGGETCQLYDRLNEEMPQLFELDAKIEPKACCNANTPKDGK
jgi:hypothetical protein